MRLSIPAVGVALQALTLGPAPAGAQSTVDQARLALGIGIGQTSGGGTLWSVGQQPLVSVGAATPDTIAVTRHFRRSLAVVFSGTYFPGDHFGLNVEAQLLGLGTIDACRVTSAQRASRAVEVCNDIDAQERSATSAALSVGGIVRIGSHQAIHPYLRANAGMVVTQQSFLRLSGEYTSPIGEKALLTVYDDNKTTNLQPYLSAGGGVVAVIGRGYQLRFEVRDNWVRAPAVTGATFREGLVPPSLTVGKHLLSFILAFDVMLERKRGRRY
jgi:hypothetical protein